MEKYSKITGLTPQQEKAAILLASGKTMTETAKEVKIERSTLYQWIEKAGFQAYYNSLVENIRESTKNSLLGLIDSAYKAIRESLNSKNESIRLKAALSVIDRIKDVEVGGTDPERIIRHQCTQYATLDSLGSVNFDSKKFRLLMKDNHLDP